MSLKSLLHSTTPNLYVRIRSIWWRLQTEMRIVRHTSLHDLFSVLVWQKDDWQSDLPLQEVRRLHISNTDVPTPSALLEYLRSRQVPSCEGGHTIYCTLRDLESTDFGVLSSYYPPNVGLKILKNVGPVEGTPYLFGSGHSKLQQALLHSTHQLMLVANVLHLEGIGPRIYDLVELQMGSITWAAFIVEDVSGNPPTEAQCRTVVQQLRNLVDEKWLSVVAPDGFKSSDFNCPSCNGNLLTDDSGQAYFIDFQNFVLRRHSAYLKRISEAAVPDVHFGESSFLRGGKYLYQSVPLVSRLRGKRDSDIRWHRIQELLRDADCDVSGRLVLDIGCNLGIMMARYLGAGAAWCHGWDEAEVVKHSESILLALGCTRFSHSAGKIGRADSIADDLPGFLQPSIAGSVISYLAVRRHIGWLKCLREMPWAVMIYEGHEGEDRLSTDRILAEIVEWGNIEIACMDTHSDGDSTARISAILRRI